MATASSSFDEGYGPIDETALSKLKNRTRRDTHIMQPAKDDNTPWHTVIQFDTDNPGVWPLHCYRAWHTSLEFLVNSLVSAILPLLVSNAKLLTVVRKKMNVS